MYRYDFDFAAIYVKVRKVIVGCRTIAQLQAAIKYGTLFVKLVPSNQKGAVCERLNRLIRRQLLLIRWHGEKKKA